jgi:3-deoxy-D-manno-octulosonic-acid transferase
MNLLGLKSIIKSSKKKIKSNTDIFLVDTYGETKKFFKISKVAFIGGSLVDHGGQNPIEPARYNLNIIHGPDTKNFKDVYKFFNKKKVAFKVNNLKELTNVTQKLLTNKKMKKLNLKKIGNSILKRSIVEVKDILDNEIKKT